MSQDLATIPGKLPAHLAKAAAARAEELNRAALGGVGGGESVNRISLKQSRFRLIQGGEEVGVIQESHLNLVILRTNDGVSKNFYAKKYVPGQEPEAPDCWSEDGIRPDASIKNPVHKNCAECPNNKFGSKINESTGAESKACTDVKRLAIVPANDLAYAPHQISVPAASLKDFGKYVRSLAKLDPPIPYNMVVTKVSFDMNSSYPKLLFKAVRYLTEDEYATAETLYDSDEVNKCIGKGEFSMNAQAAAEKAGHKDEEIAGEPPAAGFGGAATGASDEQDDAENEAAVAAAEVAAKKKAAAAKAKKKAAAEAKAKEEAEAEAAAEPVVTSGFGGVAPSGAKAAPSKTQPKAEPAPVDIPETEGADLDAVFGEDWDD